MPRRYQKKRDGSKWTEDDLKAALELVARKELTLSAAALRFGTPKTTLHAHVHGTRTKVGAGRATVLTPTEEKEIAVTLQVLQEIGFPLTQELAASVVQDYLKHEAIANPFNNDCPGKDWWSGFIKRWKLSERKPQHLSAKRAEGVLPEVVDAWLEKVKKVFQEVGLIKRGRAVKDLSNRMWNCDETAFCTSATSKTVIAKRGCRDVHETGGGSGREYVTVLGAGSASGVRLPPYILYKAKHLYDTWCRAGPAGALYGVSPSGWMEQANFLSWFEKMLVPAVHHLLSKGPVVLFVDVHYSHVSIDLIKSARSHGIHSPAMPQLFYSLLMWVCMAQLSRLGGRY